MSILEVSLVVAIFSTISILVVYTYIFCCDRYKFLKPWVAGWILYLASQIIVFIMVNGVHSNALFIFKQMTSILSSYFFLVGAYGFLGRAINSHWCDSVKVVLAWIIIAGGLGMHPIVIIAPVQILSVIIFVFIGAKIIKLEKKKHSLSFYLGCAFILWGLYKLDYIFFYKSVTYAPSGYFITAILQYIVAVGIILFFFRATKRELTLTQEMHRESESRYDSLFHKNHSVMLVICPETGMIVEANDAACEYYRCSRETLLSMSIKEISMSSAEEVHIDMKNAKEGKNRVFFFKHRLSSGEIRDVEIYSAPIRLQGRTLLYSIIHDITERKRAEGKVLQMAYYDGLTGLPNKMLFNDYLGEAIYSAKINGHMVGVLLLDFDRFKNINDTLGHLLGDKFLKTVSVRLRPLLNNNGYVARFGGDEFAILLPDLKTRESAVQIADKIINEFRAPVIVDGYELFPTVSIGISVSPHDGSDQETLIRNADIAMYRAKELGRDNYQVFTKEMKDDVFDKFSMVNNLRNAIARNELLLHYQPKVDMKSGEITGVEALIRWNHPVLGYVAPSHFIPIAEESGLIVPIGEWVLRTACAQNKKWQFEGLPKIRIAVNVSGRQLQAPEFLCTVVDILTKTELDPSYLELEITESTAIKNIEGTNLIIGKLKNLGVNIAMDDFGTGYSALSSLHRLNLDILKIDQSFIRGITKENQGKEITSAIITMAQALNLKVTAEGVETEEHMEFLRAQGCDAIQGYYISKPVPDEKIAEMLLRQGLDSIINATYSVDDSA
jgi:diguanylate cyclase (GGDEF)-like protein/PAS domain S-box-containing protein